MFLTIVQKERKSTLSYTCMRFFGSGFLSVSNYIGQSIFDFNLEFAKVFKISAFRWWLRSETLCGLSHWRVRLHVNRANTEWFKFRIRWQILQVHKYYITLHWLNWHKISLRLSSIDLKLNSAITKLTRDLTLYLYSVGEMYLANSE